MFSGKNRSLHCNILGGETGAAMVEYAFSASAFFMFIVIIFEVGIIGWRTVTAQYIASMTVRQAALFAGEEGNLLANGEGANFIAMQAYSHRLATSYGLDIPRAVWDQNFDICELQYVGGFTTPQAGRCQPPLAFGRYPNGRFGNPEDFIAVRIVIPTRFLLQTIWVDVTGWAAGRNEEFNS